MPKQQTRRFVYAIIVLAAVITGEILLAAHPAVFDSRARRFLMASAAPETVMIAGAIGEDPYIVVPP